MITTENDTSVNEDDEVWFLFRDFWSILIFVAVNALILKQEFL